MNPKLPLVCATLAILVAVTFWLFSGSNPEGVPEAGPGRAGDPTGQQPAQVRADGVAGGAVAEALNRETVDTVPAVTETGSGAGATFQVRGRLVDSRGVGLPELEVVLAVMRTSGEFGIPVPLPRGEGRGSPLRTRSASEGRFAFQVTADRGGYVSIGDEAYVLQKPTVSFPASRSDVDLGDIEVLRAAGVAGVVQDAAGRPLAGVRVGVHRGAHPVIGGGESSTTSKEDGSFQIGRVWPGQVTLRTASPRHLPGIEQFELDEGERRTDLVVSLREGQAITGQVIDDLGAPIAGIRVGAMRNEERGGVSVRRFSGDEAAETDEHGWFVLAGLATESATVRASGSGYTTVTEANVPVGTANLVLRLQRLGRVTGVLRDRQGRPIEGSRVTASTPRRGGPGTGAFLAELDVPEAMLDGRTATVTAADGSFVVEGVRPGAVTVQARGRHHRPAQQPGVVVRPGETTSDVRLMADPGATVRATVADTSGRPVAGATVRVTRPEQEEEEKAGAMRYRRVEEVDGEGVIFDSSGRRLGEGVTGVDGVAEVGGLPGGSVVVEASHDDLAEARPQLLMLPSSGTVDARLVLRRGGHAVIAVMDPSRTPVGNASFIVHGPVGEAGSERDRDATADAEGLARLGPLPAGSYWAELSLEPASTRLGEAMVFTLEGKRSLRQSRVPFVITEDGTTAVTIVRPILTLLRGEVTGASGVAPGVEVEIEPLAEGGEPGPSQTRTAVTDATGAYQIADLEAGRYTLRYGRPGQLVKASEEIEVLPNTPDLVRNLLLRLGKLRVAVFSKVDAEPIEGAEVTLLRGGAASAGRPRERRMMMVSVNIDNSGGSGETTTMTMGSQRAKTDVDGIAEIDDVPVGKWTVRLRDDKHVTHDLADQTVSEGALTDCGTVEMAQAGRLSGRVLDGEGKTVPIAMVIYRRAGSTDEEREPAVGGSFRLNGLAPGKYLLKAQALGPTPGSGSFGPEVEAEVVAGRTMNTDLRLR